MARYQLITQDPNGFRRFVGEFRFRFTAKRKVKKLFKELKKPIDYYIERIWQYVRNIY